MLKRSSGFTLIELIVVISILGILAVVALPKFMDVSDNAGLAVMKSTAGALTSSAEGMKSTWLIEEKPLKMTTETGEELCFTSQGYPLGYASKCEATKASCETLFKGLMKTDIELTFEVDSDTERCRFIRNADKDSKLEVEYNHTTGMAYIAS